MVVAIEEYAWLIPLVEQPDRPFPQDHDSEPKGNP